MEGYTIKKGAKMPPVEDIKQAHAMAVEAMLPAGPETILRALHKLRLGTASRDLSEDDRQAQVLLYAEHLASYPAVVVNEATEHLLSNARFFPPLADVLAACEERSEKPRALLRCLEGMLELAAGRPAFLCGSQPWLRVSSYLRENYR
ncbi:MAG: hypothetical protein O6944_04910, partial [Gammaproteobacteria bacterium]|nr:hypothetical protein [Gammaproteobacteria bacterium]